MQAVWQCLRSPWYLTAVLFNDDSDSKPEIWRFFKQHKLQGSLLDSDFLGWKKKGEASAPKKM